MAQYTRKPSIFLFNGLSLSHSIDALPIGKYPIARNIRSYIQGVIQSRPGQTAFNAVATIGNSLVHSIKRLNDDLATATQSFSIFAGVGTSIYSDTSLHNSLISRASGFSGNPLSMIPFRPNNSPEPYLYVSDNLKSGKFKIDGSFSNQGIPTPIQPPTVILARQLISPFFSLSQGVANGWAIGGTAALTSVNQTRTNTTITRVLYDDITLATSDFVSIQPASFQEINVGCRPIIKGTTNLVEQVFEPCHSALISAIAYDVGATGLCSVVLDAPSKVGLRKDACILINGEMVRILDVLQGPNNSLSIRVSTTIHHNAGEPIIGIATFRVSGVIDPSWAPADAITQSDHKLAIAAGIGFYTHVGNVDASLIGTRPLTSRDWVHIAIKMDVPLNLTEGKLMFDVDETTNDFTKNYYYFAFNSNDFTPAVNDQITTLLARQTKLQNNLIDAQARGKQAIIDRIQNRLAGTEKRLKKLQETATTPPLGVGQSTAARFETVAGASQWTEFYIKLSDDNLTRVGGDISRSLATIKAVRIQFNVSDVINVDVCDFYFVGGYGAEVSPVDTPYSYAYRYRSSTTGAISAWSPILRTGVIPRRQLVNITPTPSLDTQADKIDIARFGGTLNTWTIIGTQINSGNFGDELEDLAISNFLPANLTEGYQPFPTLDLSATSTVTVVGSSITRTGGAFFNLKWIPGVDVIINGQLYTLYSVISTTVMFIVENAGALVNADCFIPEPEIAATTLPAMWGPFSHEGEESSVMFACGDTNNAGTLYWTNFDNPDLASDKNFYEVTNPSEQLLNGFIHDSRSWVFSSEELYQIYPTFSNGKLIFKATKTGLGLGLAGRYAFCVAQGKIFFLSKDGIYSTDGSIPQSITDEDLFLLFPHDGQPGISILGFSPPDYSNPNMLRLSYGDSELRFDYVGIDGTPHTLLYNLTTKAWIADDYFRHIMTSYYEEGKGTHRWLLGSDNGKIYINSGFNDDGQSISCELRTLSDNGGDNRIQKKFGDFFIDYDPNGIVIAAQIGFDKYTVLPAVVNLPSAVGRQQQTQDINNGQWTYAKDLAIDLSWSSSIATPSLYAYEITGIPTEEDTLKRSTDADNLGIDGAKFVQGFRLRANTYNQVKGFKIQSDTGVDGLWQDQQTFSIKSNGESIQPFSFTSPFISHLVRIIGTDNIPWSLQGYDFVFEPEPELVENWISQQTTHNLINYQYLGFLQLTLLSTQIVNLTLIIDGVSQAPIAIPSTSGLRLKTYVRVPALKGKTFQYKLVSNVVGTGFRVYQRDLEVAVKSWGSQEMFQTIQPFGDISRENGARI